MRRDRVHTHSHPSTRPSGPGASTSICSERPDEPVDEHADTWRQLSVRRIKQRDRCGRRRKVGQYGNERSLRQIAFYVIARHLDQPETKSGGGDKTFRSVHRHSSRQMYVAHDAVDDEFERQQLPRRASSCFTASVTVERGRRRSSAASVKLRRSATRVNTRIASNRSISIVRESRIVMPDHDGLSGRRKGPCVSQQKRTKPRTLIR